MVISKEGRKQGRKKRMKEGMEDMCKEEKLRSKQANETAGSEERKEGSMDG